MERPGSETSQAVDQQADLHQSPARQIQTLKAAAANSNNNNTNIINNSNNSSPNKSNGSPARTVNNFNQLNGNSTFQKSPSHQTDSGPHEEDVSLFIGEILDKIEREILEARQRKSPSPSSDAATSNPNPPDPPNQLELAAHDSSAATLTDSQATDIISPNEMKTLTTMPDTQLIMPEEADDEHTNNDTITTLTTKKPTPDPIETDEHAKEMVTLRNLEISPPPLATMTNVQEQGKNNEQTNTNHMQKDAANETTARKTGARRKRADPVASPDLNSSKESAGGRSKRQRTQTKLFQAGDAKPSTSAEPVSPLSSSAESPSLVKVPRARTSSAKVRKRTQANNLDTSEGNESTSDAQLSKPVHTTEQDRQHMIRPDLRDVIFYEKNDYLAIRNEENSFYLCQLTENVRVVKPMIKVKWLDTNDGGKTYYLTNHYDKIPHKSIIMPVGLNRIKNDKKEKLLFTLDDQDRENIMERLKRSLNAVPMTVDLSSSQESSVAE